jgi:hypothetical protein
MFQFSVGLLFIMMTGFQLSFNQGSDWASFINNIPGFFTRINGLESVELNIFGQLKPTV